ncbi:MULTISPECIES: DUF2303 family protein [Mycobacteroides]|uniref:Uncharacterized conserved protein n=2 Tax=Mycobacteroides abscessus TaxID=36809 RepID=A0AB38CSQ2_9MYCO|nr:DUF2303 family protein [Mycobacteroides abscessus]QST88997.1 hypothetical protein PROPHIGD100A-2_13 [Mycobacterium phage prophi100A-2]QST89746.1 hypothetical protein PROPHIGD43A-3_13 [Mycobacterium phage prophiGD43A-3]QST90467.1 hypothetical protein PROPHIGD33-1_13 [Mycobacterium phage prophiGD33-1]WJJ56556.1 hypothetical protein PROPHICCUG48898T1_11 [Mycobacterium phage prophiCCUG48898T-1]EHM15453.1 hypothetical protein MMAS_38330 [Mycobacteroides abscessus subsp. massiliense CCUG 48898 = 
MSDNTIALPKHDADLIDEPDADTPLYLVTANGENGLQTEVVDVRGKVPAAFPPRAPERRTVTDTASFLAEVTRRPLLQGLSTVWGNRDKGQVSVIYNELGTDATADYTRRNDLLTLQFVADPDWATLFKAADGEYHGQEKFGDLIEQAGHLITSHPAAEVVEIVDSIQSSSNGSFKSQIKRDTGSQHLTYSEEVTASAGTATRPLEVPREITLAARPFEDYPLIEVTCWLRLRVSQGQLFLGLFPKPYEHLVRDAWTQKTGELSEALGVPVYAANLGK